MCLDPDIRAIPHKNVRATMSGAVLDPVVPLTACPCYKVMIYGSELCGSLTVCPRYNVMIVDHVVL